MRRLTSVVLLLLLALAVAPALADGPETGVVSGKVTDTNGQPLPGVTVSITGERGSKSVITGEDGSFQFALLVPGSYELKAELEAFGTAQGVANVTAGGRVELAFKMSLSTAEEITVTSEAPMVDKFNVTAGATMQAETAGEIGATVRSFYGALQVLPGVTSDVESMDLSQSRPTVNGALWQESNVYIDGIDATFALMGGGSRVFLPSSALTEVSLEAGGGGAEYGRNVGSHTNLIVKSGTNKFHGDGAFVMSKQSWNANYDPQPELANDPNFVDTFIDQGFSPADAREQAANWVVYGPGERDGEDTDIEASFGGPMWRDKAWFFLSRGEVSTNQRDKTLDGEVFNNSSELYASIVKLNFQPGAKHSLAYTFIDAPVDRIFLLPPMGDRYNATFFDIEGDVNSLSWNWAINENIFLETKLGTQSSDEFRKSPFPFETKIQDPAYAPNPALGIYSPNNNDDAYVQNFDNTWHNGWIFADGIGPSAFPRDQLNFAMTQFAGANHELKYGLDMQQVAWEADVTRPDIISGYDLQLGTQFGYANNCAGLTVDPRFNGEDTRCFFVDYNGHGLPLGSQDSDGQNYAGYIRDRMTVGDHWTFNVGLRVEQQQLENDRGRQVIDSTTISPRFSTVYDLKGDGRQLLTLNAGRFFVQQPQWLVNAGLSEDWNGASNAFDTFIHVNSIANAFTGLPWQVSCGILDANPTLPIDLTRQDYCFSIGAVRPGRMYELVDAGFFESDIEPYHRDEAVLGYEWQFSDNWALDAKGIYWRVDNLVGFTLQRDDQFRLFTLVANYDDYASIMRNLNFVDNFVSRGLGTADQANSILDGFEEDHRSYKALQLQLNRRFRNGWAWYNNVTLSEVQGKTYGGGNGGNDLGAFNQMDDDYGRNLEAILTPAIIASFRAIPNFCGLNGLDASCIDDLAQFVGQPMSTINRFGPMPIDRPIILKSYGYKQWTFGRQDFNVGGLFLWQSGSPWERTRPTANPNVTLLDNARNTTINLFLTPRGELENEDFFQLNTSAAWGFPLGSRLRGQLRAELTNISDEQEQVATSGRTGAPLRSRRSFQQPRKVRLLASIRF